MLATDKQVSFLSRLIRDRDLATLTPEQRDWIASANLAALTVAQASRTIEALIALPQACAGIDPEHGIAYLDSQARVVLCVLSRTSGHLIGKVWDGSRFQYERGALRSLVRALTMQEAEAFGARHGVCACCGATLTDPKSVERGIGPVCAARLGAL